MIFEEIEHTQKTIPQPPSSFSSLPDEITETILASVSRWKYPLLSLVSKRFHSLISSMDIYKTRSQIGAQEICLYVCLRLPNQPYPSWFSLWGKPNQTLTKQSGENTFKQDSSGNSVVRIPFSSSHPPHITDNSTVTVGSEIYIIGGPSKEPSSSVRILDCRSYTWRDAHSMTVAREDASAVFHNEKIYVMGGCDIDDYSAKWIEVFDTKTQSWTALPGPGDDYDELRNLLRKNRNYRISNVFKGKLYIAINEKEYTYDLKDSTWKLVGEQSSFLFNNFAAWCWIDNAIYGCTFSGDLMWSDSKTERGEWREVKGLRELLEDRTMGLKAGKEFVVDCYDKKLLLMWDTKPENNIRYAKISLESRCNGREVWGEVDCVDELTFPCGAYKSFNCCSASV